MQSEITTIPVERLLPNPAQHRREFDPDKLADLAESLRQVGCLENLVVRWLANPGHYQVIAGERRLRAAKLAGLTDLPCRVVDMNDREAYLLSMLENVQRADITPFEEADGYYVLTQEHGLSIPEVAEKLGKRPQYIRERLALRGCSETVRELVTARRAGRPGLNLSEAAALAQAEPAEQDRIALLAVRSNLSLTQVRRLVELAAAGEAGQQEWKQQALLEVPPPTDVQAAAKGKLRQTLQACAEVAASTWDTAKQAPDRRQVAALVGEDLAALRETIKALRRIEAAVVGEQEDRALAGVLDGAAVAADNEEKVQLTPQQMQALARAKRIAKAGGMEAYRAQMQAQGKRGGRPKKRA